MGIWGDCRHSSDSWHSPGTPGDVAEPEGQQRRQEDQCWKLTEAVQRRQEGQVHVDLEGAWAEWQIRAITSLPRETSATRDP